MLIFLGGLFTYYGIKWVIDNNNSPFKVIILSFLMAVIVNFLSIAIVVGFAFFLKAGEAAGIQIGIMLVIGMPINLIVAVITLLLRRKDFIGKK